VLLTSVTTGYGPGSIRITLIRQPRRCRLLAGNILARVCCAAALLPAEDLGIGAAVALAHVSGISTDAWPTGTGLTARCHRLRQRADHCRLLRRGQPRQPAYWRHTCFTRLREAGMALEAIQAQTGHASIESTRLYLHLANGWLEEEYLRAAEAIEAQAVLPAGEAGRRADHRPGARPSRTWSTPTAATCRPPACSLVIRSPRWRACSSPGSGPRDGLACRWQPSAHCCSRTGGWSAG
jgi:hypothetical protein